MVTVYGYKQLMINELNSIDNNTNNFYNYKGLNFLSKMNRKNRNLVIIFHGSIPEGPNKIFFRGYDYKIHNTNIVCIADYLLTNCYNYIINWTLSSKKYDVEYIYEELFKYLINQHRYDKIIFTGTSAGGFPSIKFACKFNCIALVSNSQLYLEKHWSFTTFKNIVEKNGDKLLYKPCEIETIIDKYRPKQVIIYNNKNDSTYKLHLMPLVKYLNYTKQKHLFKIHTFSFDGIIPSGSNHHHIQFPCHAKHKVILEDILRKN